MKSFQLFVFLFLFTTVSFAQQNHFIYIQTENKQPFYVKIEDRLLSSSDVGYLVIPKLSEGKYLLSIGFPKDEWPLQKITITVQNKDVGYTLKNFNEKGWGLFNLQTMDLVMSGNSSNTNTTKETTADSFADVLADVVGAPSIKEKTVIPEEKKPEPVKSEPVKTEPVKAIAVAEVKEEKRVIEAVKPATRLSSSTDEDGRSMVYIDSYAGKSDTIRLFIPYKKEITELKKEIKEEPKPVTKAVVKQEDKQDKKFLDIEMPNPNKKPDTIVKDDSNVPVDSAVKRTPGQQKEPTAIIMTNMACKSPASEDDFTKLRKKMAAAKNDDDMIGLAKKAFKSKCFSTEQVSSLSGWFLNDEGRYNFFDAAYAHIYDTENFATLGNKLSDEYYITRFKAMIRH